MIGNVVTSRTGKRIGPLPGNGIGIPHKPKRVFLASAVTKNADAGFRFGKVRTVRLQSVWVNGNNHQLTVKMVLRRGKTSMRARARMAHLAIDIFRCMVEMRAAGGRKFVTGCALSIGSDVIASVR
jgi:hypothetical protein